MDYDQVEVKFNCINTIDQNKKLMKKINRIQTQLESNAENENYHSMIESYDKLVTILLHHSNHEITYNVMKDIKKMGGFIT